MNAVNARRASKPATGRTIRAGAALLIAAAAPAVIAAPGRAPIARTDPGADRGLVTMAVGESRVVNLSSPMADVIIADPNVVDVVVNSQRQLYLLAKGPGQSDVTITAAGGRTLYKAVARVGTNLTSIDQMLRLAMPDADIRVSTLNGLVLLTGTVAAPEDAAEAERLVGAFAGDKMNVVSRLKTATPLTVNLQVRIAEVSKQIGKQIGANFVTADQTSGFKFGVGQGRAFFNDKWTFGGPLGVGVKSVSNAAGQVIGTGVSALTAGSTFAADTKLFGLNILAALDLAENQGLATTLANPNLTALSGETASFLAGGEIPIPVSSTLGQISVDYKQYGVSLAFTPTVLADGRISMRVRPEVSQIDDSAGIKVNNLAVPGIATRRAETTVELGSGQSFMIGGLLSTSTGNSISKTPYLGDLPILGNLFKSSSFRRNETELVIIVTPYLVKPIDAHAAQMPTDGFRNANDAQRYLGAELHSGKSGEPRPGPSMAPPVTVPESAVQPQSPVKYRRGGGKDASAPGFSF